MRWLVLLAACQGPGDSGDSAADTVDTSQTDIAPGPWALFGETAAARVRLTDLDATDRYALCVDEVLADPCAGFQCQPFGMSLEGDTLELAFGRLTERGVRGGLARVQLGTDAVEWVVERLDFTLRPELYDGLCAEASATDLRCSLAAPHEVDRATDGQWVVADTMNDRVIWLGPDGDGAPRRVTRVLGRGHPLLTDAIWPNAVQVLEEGGRTLVLVEYKGRAVAGGDEVDAGALRLWDVTAEPTLLWRYPAQGALAAPHGAAVLDGPEGRRLVYGHSRGASESVEHGNLGSIGFATFDPDEPPVYLGDGVLEEEVPLGFTRGVVPGTATDTLLITDSACEKPADGCGPGRLIEVAWPSLAPPGLSGSFSPDRAHQRFVPLTRVREDLSTGPTLPYAAILLEALDGALRDATYTPCGEGRG